MSKATTLAAMASIPSREQFLPQVLASLRPQVDRLCIYLNGYSEVPACVRELTDEHVLDAHKGGDERKFHWSDKHDGIALTCDDDILYPSDYVERMTAAVAEWGGRLLVTAHGRTYVGKPRNVHDVFPGSIGHCTGAVHQSRFCNEGGTGVLAWDARVLRVPRTWPKPNNTDIQISIWAQQQGIPMWLVAHPANWIKAFPVTDGIFEKSSAEGHATRNAILRTHHWYRWQE